MPRIATAPCSDESPDNEKKLYRPIELAKRWSVSRGFIHLLMNSGKLRSVKLGAARRVPVDAVDEYEKSIGL